MLTFPDPGLLDVAGREPVAGADAGGRTAGGAAGAVVLWPAAGAVLFWPSAAAADLEAPPATADVHPAEDPDSAEADELELWGAHPTMRIPATPRAATVSNVL